MPDLGIIRDVYRYRQAAPDLATSGQPREEELAAIAAAGYDVVINLALHDDPRYSLPDEAASVAALGLAYVHIPVPFDAPTAHHLLRFFDAMDRFKGKRNLAALCCESESFRISRSVPPSAGRLARGPGFRVDV